MCNFVEVRMGWFRFDHVVWLSAALPASLTFPLSQVALHLTYSAAANTRCALRMHGMPPPHRPRCVHTRPDARRRWRAMHAGRL